MADRGDSSVLQIIYKIKKWYIFGIVRLNGDHYVYSYYRQGYYMGKYYGSGEKILTGS